MTKKNKPTKDTDERIVHPGNIEAYMTEINRRGRTRVRKLAYLAALPPFLSFSQTVHGIVKGDVERIRAVVNRNISLHNKLADIENAKRLRDDPEFDKEVNGVPTYTVFAKGAFRTWFAKRLDFAANAM